MIPCDTEGVMYRVLREGLLYCVFCMCVGCCTAVNDKHSCACITYTQECMHHIHPGTFGRVLQYLTTLTVEEAACTGILLVQQLPSLQHRQVRVCVVHLPLCAVAPQRISTHTQRISTHTQRISTHTQRISAHTQRIATPHIHHQPTTTVGCPIPPTPQPPFGPTNCSTYCWSRSRFASAAGASRHTAAAVQSSGGTPWAACRVTADQSTTQGAGT